MRGRNLLAALILPVFTAALPAAAEASLCTDLRTQLNQAREVIGNNAEARKYANALARQNMHIRKVRHDLQRLGCSSGSIVVFGGASRQVCAGLHETLASMEENRRYLTSQRDALQGSVRNGGAERRRILAALRTNGCDGSGSTIVRPDPPGENGGGEAFLRIPSPGGSSGALRTMCVRTCDGAFFPVSSNADPADFPRDAAICERMCPATQTRLYFHSLTDAESADMVSAETGEPYRSLPSAFSYRNRMPGEKPACSCGLDSAGDTAMAPETDRTSMQEANIGVASELRPSLADKPAAVPERPYDPASNKVRKIGPSFLPDETTRLDLANPAAKGPQPFQ